MPCSRTYPISFQVRRVMAVQRRPCSRACDVTRHSRDRDVVYRGYRIGETASMAGRPLVESMRGGGGVVDALTRSLESGFPLDSVTQPVATPATGGPVGAVASARSELQARVLAAVPAGRLESAFAGRVVAVRGGEFDAELSDVRADDRRLATMSRRQLPGEVDDRVQIGLRFAWSVFVEDAGPTRTRFSRFRVMPTPPVDVEALKRGAQALRHLAEGAGDGRG